MKTLSQLDGEVRKISDSLLEIYENLALSGDDIEAFEESDEGSLHLDLSRDTDRLLVDILSVYSDGASNPDILKEFEDRFTDIQFRYNNLLKFFKCHETFKFVATILSDSFWMLEALNDSTGYVFEDIDKQFKQYLTKISEGYYGYNNEAHRVQQNFFGAYFLAKSYDLKSIVKLDELQKKHTELKVPFKSDSELLAIISSIGFGLEKEYSIKKLENQKIVYGRKLLNMGFRSTAATINKSDNIGGLLGAIGFELFCFIDVTNRNLWSWSDISGSLLKQLKNFNINMSTVYKIRMLNNGVLKYKGLDELQIFAIQTLKYILENKDESEAFVSKETEIGNPDNYVYAKALYFDEDLTNLTVIQLKRLNILALNNVPFRLAKDIMVDGTKYKKWRHGLKRLGANKQFILELEDTYGDILYVSEI